MWFLLTIIPVEFLKQMTYLYSGYENIENTLKLEKNVWKPEALTAGSDARILEYIKATPL